MSNNASTPTPEGPKLTINAPASSSAAEESDFKIRSKRAKSMHEQKYPLSATGYAVYQEIGHGAFAIVYRAKVLATGEEVAIKVIDLDKHSMSKGELWQEISTMRELQHENVVKIHCSFICKQYLWMVMPYLGGGSCAAIMQEVYPTGFLNEEIVATILHSLLVGLAYFHKQDKMHRDLKAGNILIGLDGSVKLADFGVAGALMREGDRQQGRTFTGTPCWMAPEVMEQSVDGYDSKADIWSLGITALELCYGMAPYATQPYMKVMLMILQNDPPTPAYYKEQNQTFKYSRDFADFLRRCLRKNPNKRKTAKELLKHNFFKKARDKSFLVQHVISKLAVTALPTEPIQIIEDYPSAAASDHNLDVHKRVPVSVKSFIFNKNDLVAFDRAKSINDQQVLQEDETNTHANAEAKTLYESKATAQAKARAKANNNNNTNSSSSSGNSQAVVSDTPGPAATTAATVPAVAVEAAAPIAAAPAVVVDQPNTVETVTVIKKTTDGKGQTTTTTTTTVLTTKIVPAEDGNTMQVTEAVETVSTVTEQTSVVEAPSVAAVATTPAVAATPKTVGRFQLVVGDAADSKAATAATTATTAPANSTPVAAAVVTEVAVPVVAPVADAPTNTTTTAPSTTTPPSTTSAPEVQPVAAQTPTINSTPATTTTKGRFKTTTYE